MDPLLSQLEFRETGEKRGGKKENRERGVLKSPCEESVTSQDKCEWLTQLNEGGESRIRG